ncbi:MAG: hypothetical protein NXI00_23325, partial [Cytophagales bacterium]|nr:hypothetical protein [Cytophagales bacterium]
MAKSLVYMAVMQRQEVVLLGFSLFILLWVGCCVGNDSVKFSDSVRDCVAEQGCTGRFWIYFTDKGHHLLSPDELQDLKTSIYDSIHPNSHKRRTKRTSEEVALDEKDFPVFAAYIEQISLLPGVRHSKTSKWLNSISVT